eukprot:227127_1
MVLSSHLFVDMLGVHTVINHIAVMALTIRMMIKMSLMTSSVREAGAIPTANTPKPLGIVFLEYDPYCCDGKPYFNTCDAECSGFSKPTAEEDALCSEGTCADTV